MEVYRHKLALNKTEQSIFCEPIKIYDSDSANAIVKKFWSANGDIEILESFYALFLDNAGQPIGWIKLSQGGTAGTVVDIKLLMSSALLINASGIIVCHNHPSGNTQPSQADIKITKQIIAAGEILNIKVLDHVITTGESRYFSFADSGLI